MSSFATIKALINSLVQSDSNVKNRFELFISQSQEICNKLVSDVKSGKELLGLKLFASISSLLEIIYTIGIIPLLPISIESFGRNENDNARSANVAESIVYV